VLNKQSRTAKKRWAFGLGVGRGANNFSTYKKQLITKCYTGSWNWRSLANMVMNLPFSPIKAWEILK